MGLIVVILLFGVLWRTNPEYDAHLRKFREGKGFVALIKTLDVDFHRINCGVFSVGEADGEMVTFGILGQVFWTCE